jgi:glycosyltransferase involved in cell wall biosynthesis
MARTAGGVVVGRPIERPFEDIAFYPAPERWALSRNKRYAKGVAATLRAIGPDLVEVHNRPEIALHLARSFPRVTLHLHNDPQGMRGAESPAERAALLRRMARVVAVSAYLRDRFLHGLGEGDVSILPNSIDVPPRVRKVRDKLILFAGRVVHDKGADAFVDACATVLPHLPGWRAEMVGADRFTSHSLPTPFTEQIHVQAARAGVSLLGYLPYHETMDCMSRAAICVVPSRWNEPFGLSALEAMAHGAALICSRRGALPEVAGDCAVYASPDAPGSIAAALLELAQDPERRNALANAARKRAELFDTRAAAERLLHLRETILA